MRRLADSIGCGGQAFNLMDATASKKKERKNKKIKKENRGEGRSSGKASSTLDRVSRRRLAGPCMGGLRVPVVTSIFDRSREHDAPLTMLNRALQPRQGVRATYATHTRSR